jgi:hypothetical protein
MALNTAAALAAAAAVSPAADPPSPLRLLLLRYPLLLAP